MLETILSRKAGGGIGTNTLLLMQADKGFTDIANPSRLVQKYSNPVIGSTQSKFSNVSFDCTGGGILIPAASKKDLVFSADKPYTIEFWAYNTSLNNVWWLYSGRSAQSDLKVYSGNVYLQDEGGSLYAPSSFMTTGKWTHVAIVGTANDKVRLFVDGKIIGVPFLPKGWGHVNQQMVIGSGEINSWAHLDQIRISNIARYTAAFTPPTDPFVID